MEGKKRKALVMDRHPFAHGGTPDVGSMQKIADADLVIVVKGDAAEIVKLGFPGGVAPDPDNYEVEVLRP